MLANNKALIKIGDNVIKGIPDLEKEESQTRSLPRVVVYHVFNSNTTTSWNEMASMIIDELRKENKSSTLKPNLEVVECQEWLNRLSTSETNVELNPSRKLLETWKAQVSLADCHHEKGDEKKMSDG